MSFNKISYWSILLLPLYLYLCDYILRIDVCVCMYVCLRDFSISLFFPILITNGSDDRYPR